VLKGYALITVTKMSGPTSPNAASPADPIELLKSRSYLVLLFFGALIGVPVALVAYFFLKWVNVVQHYVFTTLPSDLGFHGEPIWWPVLPLALCGLIVGLTIQHFHGTSGHKPAEGFKTSGAVAPIDLPGIVLAAFASLSLGAVVGPEAPLIAIGSGMGVLAVHLVKKDAPATAVAVIGAAGSFAAISTLLGSPIVGAFLLLEAAGIGGPLLGVILVPGLLAAGIGSLIFLGLDHWTGYGTFALAIPNIPPFKEIVGAELLWAVGIGLVAAVVGAAIRRMALFLQPIIEKRKVLLTPVVGLAIAGFAIAFAEASGRSSSEVLFSGEAFLPSLIQHAAGWTVGALLLLVLFKGLAYGASLSSFRGGPTFPGMFIGAAGGIALSHLPGLPLIAGVAMGIGAMTVAMLGLPLTSVLLASLFLEADAVRLMPLVIIAVVVSYVASARLAPAPPTAATGSAAGATAPHAPANHRAEPSPA
jgi:H+/Cl- antiporter ClcA